MKQWFVVYVYSGQEYKVMRLIQEKVASYNSSKIEEIMVPTRKTSKFSREGKIEVDKKLYPGYVAIYMEPDEELFKVIARTTGILSFGNKGREPQPISEEEKDRMFGYIKPETGKVTEVLFTKGESVKIIDGPFADFNGVVEEVYPDKGRVKLMVTVFGRQTPVDVSFSQVEIV
ncbi:MAG: transcription termination/antitermination factor NusG [Candidatus Stahlbacteria bacterium]|nr:transcription termination/antitermination factor NusG [Candidatus Stahlbacteria bacterium]